MNIPVKNSALILSLSILVIGCTQSEDEHIAEVAEDNILIVDTEATEDFDTWPEVTTRTTSCFENDNNGRWGIVNICSENIYYTRPTDGNDDKLFCETMGEAEGSTTTYSESGCPKGEVDRCSLSYYEDDSSIQETRSVVQYPPVDEGYLKGGEGLCTSRSSDHVYSKPFFK